MKPITNRIFLACSTLVCFAVVPAMAQNRFPEADEMTASASSQPPSLAAQLQMSTRQVEPLNRLYDDYAARRWQQEDRIEAWQQHLRQAQAPTSFDQRRATRLLNDIHNAQQKMTTDLLDTRARALKKLTPVQRAQLQVLQGDNRIKVRRDHLYQLLLMPLEESGPLVLDREAEPRASLPRARSARNTRRNSPRRAKGSGRYGVYGGYGYGGPQYGVQGSYGEGPIGVYAGIGRGGPSFGIGVGGIFGGWRHR